MLLLSDPHLFALLYACCAATVDPPEELRSVPQKASNSSSEKIIETLKDLQQQFGGAVSGQFAQLYLLGFDVHSNFNHDPDKLTQLMEQWQQEASTQASELISMQESNVLRLAKLLNLSKVERDLFLLQLNSNLPGFNYLLEMVFSFQDLAMSTLASMLDTDTGKILDALDDEATLVKSGLLTVNRRPLKISKPSENMRSALLEATNDKEFAQIFVKQLESSSSTASLARLDERDADILLSLMETKPSKKQPVNVLVYGPRSVDKQDMLARLFKDNGLHAYSMASREVPPSDMPAWTFIAQRWVEENEPDSILVLDRAEQALASHKANLMQMFTMFGEMQEEIEPEKASDFGLTSSGVSCVWLSEQPKLLSERNLARFLFHCEAHPGSRSERRSRIDHVINEFELSDDLRSHLSKFSLLGEHQVRQAANVAKILHGQTEKNQEQREETLKRAIQQSQKILNREQTEDLRDSVTHYSLDNLNLNGKFSPEKIIKALRKRPKGTLCFYGIPGAGKTQLAEYMAVELDKPIMLRRASDILSKWLGESEQNIAKVFAEAEAEDALLLLDEADSFLRDRSLARAEWSVTQVNELLQQMERFNGIFIAATNLFEDIDAAALRRFTWKVEFLPLTPEQSWQMFKTESGFKETQKSKAEATQLKEQLLEIENLAPGDFATVKRQAEMLDETLSAREWLEQLELEANAKMTGLSRNKLGFG